MNTKKIILLSCMASSMSHKTHCASCMVEDAPALNRGVTLPADAKEMVHQNVSEQDAQQFRNLVQDFCNSYNATHNAKQSHGDDTPVEQATPTMPSQQDQQRVLAEIMRGLGSSDQSRPKADTAVNQIVP